MPLSDNKRQGFQNKIIEAVARRSRRGSQLLLAPLPGARADARDVRQQRMRHPARHAGRQLGGADDHPDLPLDLRARLRADKHYDFKGLDDPRLKDAARSASTSTPAIRIALARRGHQESRARIIVSLDADLRPENQPWRQVQKVRRRQARRGRRLGAVRRLAQDHEGRAASTLQPVNLMEDEIPLEFSLAIGVQNTDVVLKFMLD